VKAKISTATQYSTKEIVVKAYWQDYFTFHYLCKWAAVYLVYIWITLNKPARGRDWFLVLKIKGKRFV
jgi:hypothetical protein